MKRTKENTLALLKEMEKHYQFMYELWDNDENKDLSERYFGRYDAIHDVIKLMENKDYFNHLCDLFEL